MVKKSIFPPPEAWHVVQQKQRRVKPTTQIKGKTKINDDVGLEREAGEMGAKALSITQFKKDKSIISTKLNKM